MRFQLPWNVLLYLFFSIGTVVGQQPFSQEKDKVVMVPREVALVTVAYQPDCPLQFENVSFFAGVDGGGATNYNLRNRGSKSIRAFAVGDSIGNRWSWDVERYHGPVSPGELVPQSEGSVQILPLTKELRNRLKLNGPMQGLIVLMVIRVEFTDGTVYDDEPVYKAARAYMDTLQNKLNQLEYLKNKSK
jgi:hypothetical protein